MILILKQVDPNLRIGSWRDVKDHKYFSDIDWNLIESFMFKQESELEKKIQDIFDVDVYLDDIGKALL